MRKNPRRWFILAISLFATYYLIAQQTVGLFQFEEETSSGYTLFSPLFGTNTYLINNCGQLVNSWENDLKPSNSQYLLPDGTLIQAARTIPDPNPHFVFGGSGERIQALDWEGNILWQFIFSDSLNRMHHDIETIPNGNILCLTWEKKTRAEAIAAGRDSNLIVEGELWAEQVIEYNPILDSIVWRWHIWDHLVQNFDSSQANYGVISEHPELMDINYVNGPGSNGGANWMHMNAIDYHPQMNQILLSSHFLGEIYIIDHSTTTEQASGHTAGISGKGGDFLYRWGNPEAYDHGRADDRKFFAQHGVHWIPAGLPDEGRILLLNNGNGRPDGNYSTVEWIEPEMDDYFIGSYAYSPGKPFGPDSAQIVYQGDPVDEFYSSFAGSVQRLSNGHTLIVEGANGRIFEINDLGNIIWEYVNPDTDQGPLSIDNEIPASGGRNANAIFRAEKYGEDYTAFENRSLISMGKLELNGPDTCNLTTASEDYPSDIKYKISPNPVKDQFLIQGGNAQTVLEIFDLYGRKIWNGKSDIGYKELNISYFNPGIYLLRINQSQIIRIVKQG